MNLSVRIIPNDEGGFTAICPTLPGCMSKGRTREEARQRLDEAICGYFAALNNFVPANLSWEIVEVEPVS
jgi:predicted RNase H-like HicB family nuclease